MGGSGNFNKKMGEFSSQNRVFGVSILNLKVKDGNSKNSILGWKLPHFFITPPQKKGVFYGGPVTYIQMWLNWTFIKIWAHFLVFGVSILNL